MTFIEERDALFSKALKIEKNEDIRDDFKREFFDLVGKVIIDMLSSEDNFFGGFMIKIEREIRVDITWYISNSTKDKWVYYVL
ncbi:MAG: hypothetical protein ACLR3R_11995 [Clostridium paraputrificum]